MKKTKEGYEEYISCGCHSYNHTLRFHIWTWEGNENEVPELEISIGLPRDESFFQRLKDGIKYIIYGFGKYSGDSGLWAIDDPKDAERIRDIANKYLEMRE